MDVAGLGSSGILGLVAADFSLVPKLYLGTRESLHRRAQSLARDDGVPLDQFIATALAEKVAVLDADRYIRERAAHGTREKFDRVLSKVPDVEPEERDRLSAQDTAQTSRQARRSRKLRLMRNSPPSASFSR